MRVRVMWEPRDLWIGLFWDRRPGLVLFICVLPCVPVRIDFEEPAR